MSKIDIQCTRVSSRNTLSFGTSKVPLTSIFFSKLFRLSLKSDTQANSMKSISSNLLLFYLKFKGLTGLKSLSIFKCGLTDNSVEFLKYLVNLSSLDLSVNQLTDINILFQPHLPL